MRLQQHVPLAGERAPIRLARSLCCLIALLGFLHGPMASANRAAPWTGQSLDGHACSSFGLTQGFGPYDYTNPRHVREHLSVVENAHFTRQVRRLEGGKNSRLAIGDITYTLRAFPNHHQALMSMIRYHTTPGFLDRDLATGRTDRRLPPECWFQRAARFSPEDANVPFLHGLYLHRIERFDQAERKYREAIRMEPDNPEFHYNLGLLLTRVEQYEEARRHARKAYESGYPLPGLRQRLARAGYPL